ncbi:uncharacterized protein E0L32_011862 [Thyridium curvatum]|uniref:Uncharacterized protein n=1 Tax=Thyridium curvatum TaxID=1093900 RepID=A0A507BEZ0_9PEZI|nr:uncharacterized protein E0L32_011862 [Thyridium curvatum]TPX18043.1 hypothetical protein E0L32_011862 [Thyridium curvatum]
MSNHARQSNRSLDPIPSQTPQDDRLETGGAQLSTATAPLDHVGTGRLKEKELLNNGETSNRDYATGLRILELEGLSTDRLRQAENTTSQLVLATNQMAASSSKVLSQIDGTKPRRHFDLEQLRRELDVLEQSHSLLDEEVQDLEDLADECRSVLIVCEEERNKLFQFILKLERLDAMNANVGIDDLHSRLQVRQKSSPESSTIAASTVLRAKRRRLA